MSVGSSPAQPTNYWRSYNGEYNTLLKCEYGFDSCTPDQLHYGIIMNNTVTEFQVLERYDPVQQKVWRVELQYRQVIKNAGGSTIYAGFWEIVPRVRIHEAEIK